MTDQQYHYYQFYDWHRKSALYKYNIYTNAKNKIKNAIAIGRDPRIDPDLKPYWILISEDDQKFFASEIRDLGLTFEDESVPNKKNGQ